jgi:hypothetical protein
VVGITQVDSTGKAVTVKDLKEGKQISVCIPVHDDAVDLSTLEAVFVFII